MMALRERILKSRLYRFVLLIMLFSMAGGGIISFIFSPFLKKGSMQPSIATVNDSEVTYKDYEYRLRQEIERIDYLRQQYGGQAIDVILEKSGLANPEQTALRSLISEELLNQAAQKIGLSVAQELITQKLSDPSFLISELHDIVPFEVFDKQGMINMVALTHVLKQRGLTFADFEKRLEQAIQRSMLLSIVESAAYTSLDEARDYFTTNFSKARYAIVRIPFDQYLKKVSAKPLGNDMVEKFFTDENKTKKRYWIPERRQGTFWKFKEENYHIVIADKDIEQYYQDHKRSSFMKTPLQANVRRILLALQSGVDTNAVQEKMLNIKEELDRNPEHFEKLVKEFSEDKKTAKQGGIVGYFKRGDRDPAFERAAFRLKEDGDISPVIKTQEGLEILQRVGRKAAVYKSLQEVKNDIQKILFTKKFKKRFNEEAQRVIAQIPDNKQELNKQALNKQTLDDFIAKQKAEKHSFDTALDESALAQKIFKTKQDTWNFLIDQEGNGIIFSVEHIEKKHEPSLQSVRKTVEQDLYRQQAHQALDVDAQELITRAKTEDLQLLKDQFKVELIGTDWIKKDDKEKIKVLKDKGIPDNLLFIGKQLVTTARHNDDVYVAKREAVEPFDEVLFNDKNSEIMRTLLQEKKELEKEGFLASLHRNATIKLSEDQGTNQSRPLDDMDF